MSGGFVLLGGGQVGFSAGAYDASRSLTIDPLFSFDPPVAVNDGYRVVHDQALSIDASHGVLVGDYDPEGDALTMSLMSTTTHGELTLNADGSFTYTPEALYVGPDSFTYQLSNGI